MSDKQVPPPVQTIGKVTGNPIPNETLQAIHAYLTRALQGLGPAVFTLVLARVGNEKDEKVQSAVMSGGNAEARDIADTPAMGRLNGAIRKQALDVAIGKE